MQNSAVVLVWNTNEVDCAQPPAISDVLLTPSVLWVLDTLEETGLKKIAIHAQKDKMPKGVFENIPVAEAPALTKWLKDDTRKNVLVLGADTPLMQTNEIVEAFERHTTSGREITLFRNKDKITGAGWYTIEALTALVEKFAGEFALTSLVDVIKELEFTYVCVDAEETSLMPANSALNRNILSTKAKERIIIAHLMNGVEIPVTDGIIISPMAKIGEKTTILPGTIITGPSIIGTGCTIGPNSKIENSLIGNNTKIISTYIENSAVGNETAIGPMSRVRPGSDIKDGVKIGNFVEVKNSNVGNKTAISHLTYVGDSDVGENCNIGCGVVTVNYDGSKKHRTTVGDHVFIGCNCNLVAPVTLENHVYAAAGTTITENVPEGALVIGRSRQTVKEHWSDNKKMFNK